MLPVIVSVVLFTAGCEFERDSGLPVDGDGNVYDTVVIGTQVWLKENLKTTKTNNGVPIPLVTDKDKWASLTTAAYCWYNNNPEYKDNYGALYNWYATRLNICPVGWHVPSKEEWETLINYVGNSAKKLKDIGFWSCPPGYNMLDCSGNNESGFSARPGGCRGSYGKFAQIGYEGVWRTSVYRDGLYEYYWYIIIDYWDQMDFNKSLEYLYGVSSQPGNDARAGFSVRCIKNN